MAIECKMYDDLKYTKNAAPTVSLISGVVPQKTYLEGAKIGVPADNRGCKCGSDYKYDPCNYK